MKVHILCTCREPDLFPMTALVFDTIRVGFPTATIVVHFNRVHGVLRAELERRVDKAGGTYTDVDTIHHEWIEGLLEEKEPFVICDTDVIFYSEVESWFRPGPPLSGWRIPEWLDAFSGCVTRARLHTSLLYIDPELVAARVAAYEAALPESPFVPQVNLVHPLCFPFKNRAYFADTCSFLYHAIGGQAFTEAQLDAYFHFNFGTISDLVLPRLPQAEQDAFRLARARVLQNRSAGRGLWRQQMEYYQGHPA